MQMHLGLLRKDMAGDGIVPSPFYSQSIAHQLIVRSAILEYSIPWRPAFRYPSRFRLWRVFIARVYIYVWFTVTKFVIIHDVEKRQLSI